MKNEHKELVDDGFELDYSISRIEQFDKIFTPEGKLQDFIDQIHEEDNTLDMKRGEFYPEILRCIISMKRAASDAYQIDGKQCHPNFGSNGSIDTILIAMKLREINRNIKPDVEGGMLVSTPTYFRNYHSASAKQLKMIQVPLRPQDWDIDIDLFLEKLTKVKPTVVFLVTPNNPTGIPIKDSHLIQIIENAPNDTLVVIDRTLVNIDNEIETKELLQRFKHKQLVILHSLSKYYGLSHLRVGFALYSNIDIAKEIQPHLPLGLGVEGAIKAIIKLKEYGALKPSKYIFNNISKSKEVLKQFTSEYPEFRYTNFSGNYCLLMLPENLSSEKITMNLQKQGIYVMSGIDFPEPMDNVIRLHTGGKVEFMLDTVEALKKIVRD